MTSEMIWSTGMEIYCRYPTFHFRQHSELNKALQI